MIKWLLMTSLSLTAKQCLYIEYNKKFILNNFAKLITVKAIEH